ILPSLNIVSEHVVATRYAIIIGVIILLTLPFLLTSAKSVTSHSIWAHPHFSGATLAQFFYVAAQAGIFSFFINSMTVDKNNGYSMVPPLPTSWSAGFLETRNLIETRTAFAPGEIKDFPAVAAWLKAKADPVAAFVNSQLSANTATALGTYENGSPVPVPLQKGIVGDLNQIIRQEINNKPGGTDRQPAVYDAQRFSGVKLSDKAQALVA